MARTEASSLQPLEWAILEGDPPTPVKALQDCSHSPHACTTLTSWESLNQKHSVPKFLSHRKCETINVYCFETSFWGNLLHSKRESIQISSTIIHIWQIRNQSTEKLSHLPKITLLENGGVRIQTQETPESVLSIIVMLLSCQLVWNLISLNSWCLLAVETHAFWEDPLLSEFVSGRLRSSFCFRQ